MNHSFSKFFLVIALALGVCTLVSCKKKASERPQDFESGINGVAVQPLPPIDEAMANVNLDDLDAIPSHRSTGMADDSYVPPTATRSRDEFNDEETSDSISDTPIAVEEDEPYEESSFSSSDFDSDDANSF